MFTQVLALLGLLACVALAVHMALRPNQRRWVDARLRRAAWQLQEAWQKLGAWRRRGRLHKAATVEAEAAIERARHKAQGRPEGEWDGNVYRPTRFGSGDKRDRRKLH